MLQVRIDFTTRNCETFSPSINSGDSPSQYLLQFSIPRVTRNDVGRYSCHLVTTHDSVGSREARLRVREATRIVRQPSHHTAWEGETVQFR